MKQKKRAKATLSQSNSARHSTIISTTACRLINIEDYKIKGYDDMHGFIAGLMASNYDCTDIFVDGLLRIVGRDFTEVGRLLDRIAEITDSTCVTFTISAEPGELPDEVKKYL
jgi:hypothetical protein